MFSFLDLPISSNLYSNSIVTMSNGTIYFCENDVPDLKRQKKEKEMVILVLSDKNGEEITVYSSDIAHIEYSD